MVIHNIASSRKSSSDHEVSEYMEYMAKITGNIFVFS